VQEAPALELAERTEELEDRARVPLVEPRDLARAPPEELEEVEHRPRDLGRRRRRRALSARPRPRAKLAERAAVAGLARDALERRALDQQAHRDEGRERRGRREHGDAIGAQLDLPHHARPSAQREARLGEERLSLAGAHAERVERSLDRVHRIERCARFVLQEAAERAELGKRRAGVELDEAAIEPLRSRGHWPTRDALIEEDRARADQERMHDEVEVGPAAREDRVAMPHERRRLQRAPLARALGDVEAGLPQLAHHRRLALARRALALARRREALADLGRNVGAHAIENVGLFEQPRERVAGRARVAEGEELLRDLAPRRAERDDVIGVAQIGIEHAVEIVARDAAARELALVLRFGEEGLAPEQRRAAHDGLLEGQILERVERVVVDEDGDRALGGEQMRRMLERGVQFLARRLIGRAGLGFWDPRHGSRRAYSPATRAVESPADRYGMQTKRSVPPSVGVSSQV
jgi:hypothetical protein